jgi:NADH:ubiquinone reductase (H+-translocating)
MTQRHQVVIVGAGFGGLYATKALADAPVDITLLDRKNHHTFQPLLYQVATAGLNPADIATPIRSILRRQKNVEVLLADVEGIDVDAKTVAVKNGGDLQYDTLIVATGATHSYFGHNEWERFAPGLKTIEDALEIRKRVFFAYEAAEREEDPEMRKAWLTFVVVGGGPTGVELAGTLGEIAKNTLTHDFRRLDPKDTHVLLLEGSPDLLGAYPADLREKARQQLERLGVDVRVNARVTAIDPEGVNVGSERIAARTALWAAGVAASPLVKSLGAPLDRAGRVQVEADLTLPGHPDVFVIGDVAAVMQDGTPVPGVAPSAIQEAKHTAKNIKRALRGKPREPFRYIDKGSLATIGRGSAIAQIGKLKLSGFLAWLAWLGIHIIFLIGFRNRFLVMLEWGMSFITYSRGARLITGNLPPAPIRALPPTSRRPGATASAPSTAAATAAVNAPPAS